MKIQITKWFWLRISIWEVSIKSALKSFLENLSRMKVSINVLKNNCKFVKNRHFFTSALQRSFDGIDVRWIHSWDWWMAATDVLESFRSVNSTYAMGSPYGYSSVCRLGTMSCIRLVLSETLNPIVPRKAKIFLVKTSERKTSRRKRNRLWRCNLYASLWRRCNFYRQATNQM